MTTELLIDLAARRQRHEIRRALYQRTMQRLEEELLNLSQGGAAVAHQTHTLEVAGSTPAPATNTRTPQKHDGVVIGSVEGPAAADADGAPRSPGFTKNDPRASAQCAAVVREPEDAKGLARDGYKPLMRSREAHERPSPTGLAAAHTLSEVSGPAEPDARLALDNEHSRNNSPKSPSPGAILMGQIEAPFTNSGASTSEMIKRPAAASNPNGTPEVYNQVHKFPKGRWS